MQMLKQICPDVMDYFRPWFVTLTPDSVACFSGTAGVAEPHMARQHFMFHSAIDTLCFCHLYPHLLQKPGSNVFTALGSIPTAGQLQELKRLFPNARTVGVFDDDLCGKVLDCKVSLWQMNRDALFTLIDGKVSFNYKGNTFEIPKEKFSLHRFRTITGIRSSYRTLKPKGFVSFASMLACSLNNQ